MTLIASLSSLLSSSSLSSLLLLSWACFTIMTSMIMTTATSTEAFFLISPPPLTTSTSMSTSKTVSFFHPPEKNKNKKKALGSNSSSSRSSSSHHDRRGVCRHMTTPCDNNNNNFIMMSNDMEDDEDTTKTRSSNIVQNRRSFFTFTTTTTTAATTMMMMYPIEAAYAKGKKEEITSEIIKNAFDDIRNELYSSNDDSSNTFTTIGAGGGIPYLETLINEKKWDEIKLFTKFYDLEFRKAKLGRARKLMSYSNNKMKDESIQISNNVTFDLIGINRASRIGDLQTAKRYLDELKDDVETFLLYEKDIVVPSSPP